MYSELVSQFIPEARGRELSEVRKFQGTGLSQRSSRDLQNANEYSYDGPFIDFEEFEFDFQDPIPWDDELLPYDDT